MLRGGAPVVHLPGTPVGASASILRLFRCCRAPTRPARDAAEDPHAGSRSRAAGLSSNLPNGPDGSTRAVLQDGRRLAPTGGRTCRSGAGADRKADTALVVPL